LTQALHLAVSHALLAPLAPPAQLDGATEVAGVAGGLLVMMVVFFGY